MVDGKKPILSNLREYDISPYNSILTGQFYHWYHTRTEVIYNSFKFFELKQNFDLLYFHLNLSFENKWKKRICFRDIKNMSK